MVISAVDITSMGPCGRPLVKGRRYAVLSSFIFPMLVSLFGGQVDINILSINSIQRWKIFDVALGMA